MARGDVTFDDWPVTYYTKVSNVALGYEATQQSCYEFLQRSVGANNYLNTVSSTQNIYAYNQILCS